MNKKNSYVRIFQDKLNRINKIKEKQKQKEEKNIDYYSLPEVIFPNNNIEEQTDKNGINFENLEDWNQTNNINSGNENQQLNNINNNLEDEKNIQNYIFQQEKKLDKKNKNKNYDFIEVKPIKENKEFLLFNKFSQKPIMPISNPYIKNYYQGINNNNNLNNFNTIESENKDNENRSSIQSNNNIKENIIEVNENNIDINNSIKENTIEIKENNFDINNNEKTIEMNDNNEINNNVYFTNEENKKKIKKENIEDTIKNNDNIENNYNKEYNKDFTNKSNLNEKEEKKKIHKNIPTNLNESDIITNSLSDDDSFNLTKYQMNILNKEATQFYNRLSKNLSNKIYHLKYPYLNKGNSNIYERNNLLRSLINKQKQLINKSNNNSKKKIEQTKRNSVDLSKNIKGDFITQIPLNNNLSDNKNSNKLPITNDLINSYNTKNENKLPKIINKNNNFSNKNKEKKILYKPYSIEEFKENTKKFNYRYPSSLSNIGTPQWEENNKKYIKKYEYCKSLLKIELERMKLYNKKKLNKSEIIKKKENEKEENEKNILTDSLKEESEKKFDKNLLLNNKEKNNKLNKSKLPLIPKFPIRKKLRNINNNNNEDELNQILSENRQLGTLLLSHELYHSAAERIKQSL